MTTKCYWCQRIIYAIDYYPFPIFCSHVCLQKHNSDYFNSNVEEYVDENIYEIVKDNREVAREVLLP